MNAPARTYLSPSEAAGYLAVTERTLTEWRRSGRGPCYTRLGGSPTGRIRYLIADLDDFMAAQRFPHTAAERTSA